MKDPLYRQSEQETERLTADRGTMRAASRILLLKIVTGFFALMLFAVIMLFWRFG